MKKLFLGAMLFLSFGAWAQKKAKADPATAQINANKEAALSALNNAYESDKKIYFKSQAVFQIVKNLGGILKFSLIFTLLPTAFTNRMYDLVAKNRYRWFVKKEHCLVPTKEIQSKFLE